MSYLLFINKVLADLPHFWRQIVPKLQPSKPNHTHRISNVLSVRSKHCTESLVFVWSSLLVPVFEHYEEIERPHMARLFAWLRKSKKISHTLTDRSSHYSLAHKLCIEYMSSHHTHTLWSLTPLFTLLWGFPCVLVSLPPLFWPNEDQQLPHGAERWIS